MPLEVFEDDDTTPVEDLPFTGLDAGADSDTITVHIRNTGVATEPNVRLKLQVEHPSVANLFVSTGFPPMDELWGRARISGFDNTGDPTWSLASTDWQAMGAYSDLLVGDVPADCTIYLELRQRPPSSATAMFWRWALGYYSSVYSVPVPQAVALLDRGIFHGVGDYGRSGLVRGFAVTPTGTPDDKVHVAAGQVVYQGKLLGFTKTDHTLSQSDSAAAALAVGQSYIAVGTVNASGPHYTKGLKGVSPVAPTPPAGEPLLPQPYVTVQYDAGGGAIDGADITGEGLYDRFWCEAGSGLQVEIHRGRALGGGTERYAENKQLVPVPASDTVYLYQLASGLWEYATSETPPETTATGPWWEVDTDGSGVTAVRDRRQYAGKSKVIVLEGAISGGAPAAIAEVMIEDDRLYLEVVAVRIPANGGSSGNTVFNAKKNGTTIYTSSGTDDQRPTLAYNATPTDVHRSGIPEVTEFVRGDILSFHTASHPSGGAPTAAEGHFVFRVP